ncbi:MAG: type VI secretion system contractile sheath large subunit [Planctomycetes bacterium]|nr:type VI secretion system contractile sheath large subunit [Planctomycetota bacterium]
MADQPNPSELEITESSPGGLHVTKDFPYGILYVADFAGTGAGNLSGPLSDGVVRVTPDTFDDLMAKACPSVSVKTSDPLASGNVMVQVDVKFDSLKAFEPSALLTQIPVAQTMFAMREKLVARMRGKCEFADVERAASSAVKADSNLAWLGDSLKWSAAAAQNDPGAVDSLLGQIDLGDGSGGGDDEASAPPKSPIGSVIAAAAGAGSSIPSEEASVVRRTIGEIDRRISAWLTTILHAPEVLAIEKAWRSLNLLVSTLDFRKGVRLTVLHASDDELLDRFRTLLIDPVFDEGADQPHLLIIDKQFGNKAPDLEALDEFAQHAASLPAIAMAGVSTEFFGVKYGFQMATLPTIANVMDQWQFAKWKALRGQQYARSLGVVYGRCLLREPFGRDGKDDLEFTFKEESVTDKALVWGSGVIAAACTIARSVADSGWPTAMSGVAHGRVEGFKTCVGGKKGDKKFGPSDVQMPQEKVEELGRAGINATAPMRDLDDVFFCNGMTAARPSRDEMSAVFEVSLPYQLFATRLSAMLFALKPHLSGKSAEQVASDVTTHVRDWLGVQEGAEEEQVAIQVRPAQDAPGSLEMAVTVTAPESVLPGGVPVVMGYRI